MAMIVCPHCGEQVSEKAKKCVHWLDANRNQLALEAEITRMFARVLADMRIILMNKDKDNEIKETLQEAIARMNVRAKKYPELNNSVAYTIVLAIYDKLLSLIGTDQLFYEAEMTGKLIESYTAYLKCSNKACKETKYLTVDLMNWYINSHNIKCPKRDGGELKGGLGKYGPYVRCNCGHFLKPDEI